MRKHLISSTPESDAKWLKWGMAKWENDDFRKFMPERGLIVTVEEELVRVIRLTHTVIKLVAMPNPEPYTRLTVGYDILQGSIFHAAASGAKGITYTSADPFAANHETVSGKPAYTYTGLIPWVSVRTSTGMTVAAKQREGDHPQTSAYQALANAPVQWLTEYLLCSYDGRAWPGGGYLPIYFEIRGSLLAYQYYSLLTVPPPFNLPFNLPPDCINPAPNVAYETDSAHSAAYKSFYDRKKSWLKKNSDTVLASLVAKKLPCDWEFTLRANAPVSSSLQLSPALTETTTVEPSGYTRVSFSYRPPKPAPTEENPEPELPKLKTHTESGTPSKYSNWNPSNFSAPEIEAFSRNALPYFHNPTGGLLTLGAFLSGENYPGNRTDSTWGVPTDYNADLKTVRWIAAMPEFLREYQKTAKIVPVPKDPPTDGSTPLGVAFVDGMGIRLSVYERILPSPNESLGIFWRIGDLVYRARSSAAYTADARTTIKYKVLGIAELHYELSTLSFVFDTWTDVSELLSQAESDVIPDSKKVEAFKNGFIFEGVLPENTNCMIEYLSPLINGPSGSLSKGDKELKDFKLSLLGTPPKKAADEGS